MSGLFRNLLTVILALPHQASATPTFKSVVWFRVGPFDTGIATLKSDRYLLFAEAAQLDFVIRTGLLRTMLRDRIGFVNASQLVRFAKPIRLLDRVEVSSQVVHTDEKFAYFSHVFQVHGARHAEVLVKMKFKKGSLTVSRSALLGLFGGEKPDRLQCWDDALAMV